MTEPVWTLDNNSNGRPFLPTNSWKALKQRLHRTPELALVSLAGTRCSNSQILVLKLNINPELINMFSQLTSCNKPSYCSIPLRTNSLLFFPFSPMNFLNIIPPEWFLFLENIWATSALFIGYFLKDCLGLFWVSCHLLSHLLWSHFLGGSWPQI